MPRRPAVAAACSRHRGDERAALRRGGRGVALAGRGGVALLTRARRRREVDGTTMEGLDEGRASRGRAAERRARGVEVREARARGGATFSEVGDAPARGGATFSEVGDAPARGGATFSEVGDAPARGGATFSEVGDARARGGATFSEVRDAQARGGATLSEVGDARARARDLLGSPDISTGRRPHEAPRSQHQRPRRRSAPPLLRSDVGFGDTALRAPGPPASSAPWTLTASGRYVVGTTARLHLTE